MKGSGRRMLSPPKRTRQLTPAKRKRDKHPPVTNVGHVILLGPPGSGKSTTIRTLFQNQSTASTAKSDTSQILEFRTADLRVIDTPGLGLVNNERDALIVASFKHFLDKDSILCASIPHVVLLVAKFNDPKIHSPHSPFVRSLRGLNLLSNRLFSQEYCNLIVLLTHLMDARKYVREDPNPRIQLVRDIVRQELNKSCHVVIGENEADGWGLARMPAGHRLPTGDIYPGNVHDLIKEVMGRTGLQVGPFELNPSLRLVKSIPLISEPNSRFKKALEALNWSNGIVTAFI